MDQSQTNNYSYGNGNNDVLLNKINYMINLLEDQQDERTNNVTEEVVLYSFLGIFIIFVVDSFARVGKYTR
jgi:high-affinity K+ transport system ATPase subunit B